METKLRYKFLVQHAAEPLDLEIIFFSESKGFTACRNAAENPYITLYITKLPSWETLVLY